MMTVHIQEINANLSLRARDAVFLSVLGLATQTIILAQNPSPMAVVTAQRIGLDQEDVERFESQLVRLNLEYCRKQRISECPLGNKCADKS